MQIYTFFLKKMLLSKLSNSEKINYFNFDWIFEEKNQKANFT